MQRCCIIRVGISHEKRCLQLPERPRGQVDGAAEIVARVREVAHGQRVPRVDVKRGKQIHVVLTLQGLAGGKQIRQLLQALLRRCKSKHRFPGGSDVAAARGGAAGGRSCVTRHNAPVTDQTVTKSARMHGVRAYELKS